MTSLRGAGLLDRKNFVSFGGAALVGFLVEANRAAH